MEVEGGKTQLQMEARDSREGDPERGGQRFVQEVLQLTPVGGGMKDDKVGQSVDGDLSIP